MPRIASWKRLLEENVEYRRWYDNLARGSQNTGNLYARTLYRVSRELELTPSDMIKRAENDLREFENMLLDYVTRKEKEGKAPSYIDNDLQILNSWLKYSGLELKRHIKVGNLNRTPTIEDERVPAKDELKQILSYAKARGKCSISLMAFSGLRPESLGYSNGLDGLEVRDLPELEINDNQVKFTNTPTMIIVRPELSKAKHRYFTFLGEEGCEYLKAYLEKRLAQGDEITKDSAVISVKQGYEDTGHRETDRNDQHITTKTLTKEIRDTMRPRYNWRPYVLRAYFDTQLLIAENNGKIAHAYRQFFMGHKGDIESRYTTNKGRLPEEMIEDMRTAYRKSLEYLETRNIEVGENTIQDSLRRQIMLVAGYSSEEIDELELDMSDPEFQKLVREKLTVPSAVSQKVIHLDELAEYLDNGWSFVATVKNDQAIVKIN